MLIRYIVFFPGIIRGIVYGLILQQIRLSRRCRPPPHRHRSEQPTAPPAIIIINR